MRSSSAGNDGFGSTGWYGIGVLQILTRPRCEDEAGGPRGTTSLAARTGAAALLGRLLRSGRNRIPRPAALTGGSRLRLLRVRIVRARLGQGLGEDVLRDRGAGFHHPGSLLPRLARVLVPVVADPPMLHPGSDRAASTARPRRSAHGGPALHGIERRMPR